MATITKMPRGTGRARTQFVVVHPLHDVSEQKLDTSKLGAMPLGRSAKFALVVLRGYLLLMIALVVYHALELAGAFKHFGR